MGEVRLLVTFAKKKLFFLLVCYKKIVFLQGDLLSEVCGFGKLF